MCVLNSVFTHRQVSKIEFFSEMATTSNVCMYCRTRHGEIMRLLQGCSMDNVLHWAFSVLIESLVLSESTRLMFTTSVAPFFTFQRSSLIFQEYPSLGRTHCGRWGQNG